MDLLFSTVEKVRARLNPRLKIAGVLPTMYEARTTHGREVLEELRETYGEQLFETVIPLTVKLADSAMAGKSICLHRKTPASVKTPVTRHFRACKTAQFGEQRSGWPLKV
jgi:cellulose biosynthesis protein BcsQ